MSKSEELTTSVDAIDLTVTSTGLSDCLRAIVAEVCALERADEEQHRLILGIESRLYELEAEVLKLGLKQEQERYICPRKQGGGGGGGGGSGGEGGSESREKEKGDHGAEDDRFIYTGSDSNADSLTLESRTTKIEGTPEHDPTEPPPDGFYTTPTRKSGKKPCRDSDEELQTQLTPQGAENHTPGAEAGLSSVETSKTITIELAPDAPIFTPSSARSSHGPALGAAAGDNPLHPVPAISGDILTDLPLLKTKLQGIHHVTSSLSDEIATHKHNLGPLVVDAINSTLR